ncbi:MAG: class I SAM-dependent methyltransferase [Myxococcota bacterium]
MEGVPSRVEGTTGYETDVDRFAATSRGLAFEHVCADFLPFLPDAPRRVLDAGAGVGQNAAALARRGHHVVAAEPLRAFLDRARADYAHLSIEWTLDALPALERVRAGAEPFAFVLVEGVWHHLDPDEQTEAVDTLADLLAPGGHAALSLRHGPPGLGTHVFPTDAARTIERARDRGLDCAYRAEGLPSLLPGKEDVSWSRVVLSKAP